MALSQAYKVADGLWVGPDSLKSNVAADSGHLYIASDTSTVYNGDSGSWNSIGTIGGGGTDVAIQDDGSGVVDPVALLNFKGSDFDVTNPTGSEADVTLTNDSVTVTAGDGLTGGGSVSLGSSVTLNAGIDIDNGGSDVINAHGINAGTNLTATDDGDGTVTMSASSGGTDVEVQDDGSTIVNPVDLLNFAGSDFDVTNPTGSNAKVVFSDDAVTQAKIAADAVGSTQLGTDAAGGSEINLSDVAGDNLTVDGTNDELDASGALTDSGTDTDSGDDYTLPNAADNIDLQSSGGVRNADVVNTEKLATGKLPVYDIRDYGAEEDNSSVDDATALNSAISQIDTDGRNAACVFIPNGVWQFETATDYGPLQTNPSGSDKSWKSGFNGLAIVGAGMGATYINLNNSEWTIAGTNKSESNVPGPLVHRGFSLDVSGLTSNGLLWSAKDAIWQNIEITGDANSNPLFHGDNWDSTWQNIWVHDVSNVGFAGAWDVNYRETDFINCTVDNVNKQGWWHNNSYDVNHIGCRVKNCSGGINGENSPVGIRVQGGAYHNNTNYGFAAMG
jgi:hypothetical protein